MAQGYSYDLYISYRRHPIWSQWVRTHVRRLLDTYLTQDLGRSPNLFVDDQIEPGADWPVKLGKALGGARLLLPIYSRDYFNSDWCIHELDLMHVRLKRLQREASSFPTLIFPARRHEQVIIPGELRDINYEDWIAFGNVDIQPNTPRMEQFGDSVRQFTPHLARAIQAVPEFDASWPVECMQRFERLYEAHCTGQSVGPDTFTPPNPPDPPVLPPRVNL